MSDSDAVFREVEEELRREQMHKLWQRYGTLVLGAALLIVASVAGFKGYDYWRTEKAAAAGARFEGAVAMLRDAKGAGADQVFKALIAEGPAGYRTLSRFRQAAETVKAGKFAEAAALYDGLAADGEVDSVLQSFARIEAASLEVDRADFTAMQNRLNALNVDTGPWRHSARELLGLSAFRAGKIEEAQKRFTEILSDTESPTGLRRRADMMMALIVADTAKPGGGAN